MTITKIFNFKKKLSVFCTHRLYSCHSWKYFQKIKMEDAKYNELLSSIRQGDQVSKLVTQFAERNQSLTNLVCQGGVESSTGWLMTWWPHPPYSWHLVNRMVQYRCSIHNVLHFPTYNTLIWWKWWLNYVELENGW